ncbi:MAG: hypothetical protein LH474_03080 [Chamaesiphon sp.]|nr:hypothetical protein [Chamaesiphon sp.]
MQTVTLANQFSIRLRSILIVGLGCMVLSLYSCSANKRGAPTPEKVVEQYLTALENKSENSLLQLADKDSSQTREIAAKIRKIGGHKIQNRQIEYDKFTPNLWKAKITGNYIDRQGIAKKTEDLISIQYQSKGEPKSYAGRWYLLIDN